MTPEELKAKADAEAKEKADAEAKAKADADAGTKLDKVLSCLDSFGKRFDSVEKRMDSLDEREKSKADADAKAKADAEEDERKKTMTAEQIAADKAKKDADEAEKKEKADADAKEKADAEEKQKIADSLSDVRKRIDAVDAKLPRAMTDTDRASMADAQAKADSVYSAFGASAPRFLEGESLIDYRKRLASKLKEHSKAWKDVDVSAIADSAVIDVAEQQIYADAMQAANHPVDVPAGVLREINRVDRATGVRMTTFVGNGNTTFIHAMKRPPRYVQSFNIRKDH